MPSAIQIEIPEELASRLKPMADRIPQILELGLREWNAAGQSGFDGAAEVLELLAGLPSPDEIIKLRPSETLQARISDLLEKNRTTGLSRNETLEWENFQYLEHLVRIAKAKAYSKLKKTLFAPPSIPGYFFPSC